MTLVVAHRGASAVAPENSLEAFAKAMELGADMVEFDVRRGPGGAIVVSHDPIDAAAAHELPRLEEVVELCAGRIALDVELKEPGLEEETRRLLAGDCVVTSFLDDVVATVKRLQPELRTGLLLGAETPLDDRIGDRQRAANADFLAPHVSLVDAGLRGDALVVWTVNDEPRLRRYLADSSVAAVITDDPALALRMR
jgi:glycerophosphoryl diester phosphodiesterase